MNLLFDTHALLWWFTDDPRLSAGARRAIADESNAVFVSAASAWEIATKHRLGKLDEATEAITRFGELVAADGFEHLPITHLHAQRAGSYRVDHRDPFDRMLAAQSELDGLALVTIDPAFKLFGTEVVW
ncbi:type II toxin-antitoxin system VapC family toxin [Pseudothauera rhizosphaerae]|uniref:Type II toxin-antitoxin system VapC family toxin n=1 Tax=Pseudothauera rhizosphaerae TaxID=2565932 RepID=A0A4S4ADC6_9RHOO|nr:type II toxin-antitoxin system VapC family toxin [Pseudothauera rhizosphaerae]THF56193.1 type II toxin-antitoxin system VapC family toxin [Pseudothauera rhizosphaerae]